MKTTLSENIQMLAEDQAAFCKVIGNPQRVMILWLLMEKEMTTNEIALAIGASQQSTTRHLNILEFNKLVKSRREERNTFYRIADNEQTQSCLLFKTRPKLY